MLYENQQIGNFNYLLGYYLGRNNYPKPFTINTYQQTFGHDKTIGDMFGNIGGKYFIIEFKRSQKNYLSELNKPHRIKLLEHLRSNPILDILSKKGHFLCHSEEFNGSLLKTKKYKYTDYRFSPYSELRAGINGNFEPIIHGIEEFIMNLAFDIVPTSKFLIGMNFTELKEYLKMMKECVGNDDYETTGTVVCFNSENGGMSSIVFENLIELNKHLSFNIERSTGLGDFLEAKKESPKLPPHIGNGFSM